MPAKTVVKPKVKTRSYCSTWWKECIKAPQKDVIYRQGESIFEIDWKILSQWLFSGCKKDNAHLQNIHSGGVIASSQVIVTLAYHLQHKFISRQSVIWKYLSHATKQLTLTSTLSKGTALNVCTDPTFSLLTPLFSRQNTCSAGLFIPGKHGTNSSQPWKKSSL